LQLVYSIKESQLVPYVSTQVVSATYDVDITSWTIIMH
jgi:hypothetical protein